MLRESREDAEGNVRMTDPMDTTPHHDLTSTTDEHVTTAGAASASGSAGSGTTTETVVGSGNFGATATSARSPRYSSTVGEGGRPSVNFYEVGSGREAAELVASLAGGGTRNSAAVERARRSSTIEELRDLRQRMSQSAQDRDGDLRQRMSQAAHEREQRQKALNVLM